MPHGLDFATQNLIKDEHTDLFASIYLSVDRTMLTVRS